MTGTPVEPAGPYSIGSSLWPGLSKLVEECGELLQVLGKIVAAGGQTGHWDGTDLRQRLIEELGDVEAASMFFTNFNQIPAEEINLRSTVKYSQFVQWHKQHSHITKPKRTRGVGW